MNEYDAPESDMAEAAFTTAIELGVITASLKDIVKNAKAQTAVLGEDAAIVILPVGPSGVTLRWKEANQLDDVEFQRVGRLSNVRSGTIVVVLATPIRIAVYAISTMVAQENWMQEYGYPFVVLDSAAKNKEPESKAVLKSPTPIPDWDDEDLDW